jgi:hypothetical protein
MPMQPLTDPPREAYTAPQIRALLQDAPALTLSGGLEIVDINLDVVQDISGSLAGGQVERSSYAVMHGTARFQITQDIDWGGDLLRPYIVVSDGVISPRWNLGVYHPTTPDYSLEETPPTFDAEGYDILLRLNQPVGDAYSLAAGTSYLTRVEEILLARGYTQYVIDQSAVGTVAPTARVWAFDDNITWLSIINDLLASIGYAGVWSDWNGRLRCSPYLLPLDRSPEWYYSDDALTTMLSTKRSVSRDYFSTPNRWVFYRSNMVEGATPVEGNGIYTFVNDSVGDTSVDARRGLVITRTESVDVADQGSLVVRAMQTIQADMDVPTQVNVQTSPNPQHWHFDRLFLQDSASLPVADVMCTQWTLPLPPSTGDMAQVWRVISQ